MAKISMEKALIAAGVGAVDLVGEQFLKDKKIGPVTGDDALRTGLTVGSFLVNWLGYETDISETVFYASLPLFVKSIKNIVSGAAGATAAPKRVVVVETKAPEEAAPTPTPLPP